MIPPSVRWKHHRQWFYVTPGVYLSVNSGSVNHEDGLLDVACHRLNNKIPRLNCMICARKECSTPSAQTYLSCRSTSSHCFSVSSRISGNCGSQATLV